MRLHAQRLPWFALLAALGALLPLLVGGSTYLMLFLSNTAVYVILALGLQVIFGWAGMFLLSQAAFYGIGAYTAALVGLDWHWTFLGQAAAAIAAACLAGLVILPIIRLRAVYFALASFALGIMVQALMNQLPFLGGVNGLSNLPTASILGHSFSSPVSTYYLSYALALLVYFAFRRLRASFFGMQLNAIRGNELAAGSCGVNVPRAQMAATLLGVGAAGLAGALVAGTQGFISPDEFSVNQSLLLIAMLVVGGMGSLPGAFWGAALIYYISSYLQGLAEYVDLVYGGIVVAIMVLLPQGLWGVVASLLRLPPVRYLRPAAAGPCVVRAGSDGVAGDA
jgi:branched-chain amino acid transport system permease protein